MEVRLIWRRDRFLRGGDQIPFLEQGYSAVRSRKRTRTSLTGNFTSYTAKRMSKDNLQFGVRAMDRDGNRSPGSFPPAAAVNRSG